MSQSYPNYPNIASVNVTMAFGTVFRTDPLNMGLPADLAVWDSPPEDRKGWVPGDRYQIDRTDYEVAFNPADLTTTHTVSNRYVIYSYSQNKVVYDMQGTIKALGSNFVFSKMYNGVAGNDVFIGNSKAESFDGLGGADRLFGNGGKDRLEGGTGNDYLDGGSSDDRLYGEDGNDTIKGGSGNDYISAGNHNDSVDGGSGNDTIHGGSGNDNLYGSSGDDYISGSSGKDTIRGGTGADDLYGGSDADVFLFKSITESTVATAGRDSIFDFSLAGGDVVNLASIDANTKVSGNQAFVFIDKQGFHGKAGELRMDVKASDTYVYGDVNGDKKADFAIHFDDALALTKYDFIL